MVSLTPLFFPWDSYCFIAMGDNYRGVVYPERGIPQKKQKELRAWIGLEKTGMKRNMGRLGFFASSLHFHLHVDL